MLTLARTACAGDISALTTKLTEQYRDYTKWPAMAAYLQKLQQSGDINYTDEQGRNPVLYCLQELPELTPSHLIQLLLLEGVSPDAAIPATGQTALHIAARSGDYRLAARLLAFGANPQVKDKKGKTPAELTTHKELYAMLLTGTPAELRSDEAHLAYRKARKGDAEAQYQMYLMYNDGCGEHVAPMSWVTDEADPDSAESHAWLEQAAAKNHPKALYGIAMCYYWGVNMPENKALAYQYLRRAAAQGYEEAVLFLKDNPPTP